MGGALRALVKYGYSKSYLGKGLKVLKRAGDNWFKLSGKCEDARNWLLINNFRTF